MPFESADTISVEELTSIEALESVRDEWLQLWRACPTTTPFQSPAWLISWWQRLAGNGLWTLAFRQSGRIIGLAPLFVYQADSRAPRQLVFIGTGISDYLDILAAPGFEAAVTAKLFEHLNAHSDRWEEATFEELSPDSILLSALQHQTFDSELVAQSVCPALQLSNNLETTVPAHMLEKLHYYQRRAAKAGTVRIEVASLDHFDSIFDSFIQLHSKRWKERGEDGVLAEAKIQNFHREAARELLKIDALRLFALSLNEEIIATLYCLRSARYYFYYLGGFDHRWSQLSPGNLLIGHAINEAIREGATEFNFLRGQEKYKYDWGAQDRVSQSVRFRTSAFKI